MKKITCLWIILSYAISSEAQDVHFSQVTNFPLLLNPALNGAYNAQARFIGAARNQNMIVPNSAFTGVYNTIGASAETKIFPEITGDNSWSIGVMGLSDYAGSGTLATTQALFSTAYQLAMDRYGQSFLSIGGQAGVTNRRIFSNDLLFETQIKEFDFDPRLPNLEPIINNGSETNFLLNIGALFQQRLGENVLTQMGFSAYNINNPKQLFYSNSNENIYSRINMMGGVLFKLDEVSKLYPSIVYMKQGNFSQTNIGMSYTRDIHDDLGLTGGVRMRMNDAFILIAGMRYKNIYPTLSYDITYSNLSRANNTVGALEFNIAFLLGDKTENNNSGRSYCPAY